jgi:hypothetical protein
MVLFLQNAWSSTYAGGSWPRQSWLRALAKSRSGQRLRTLIDDFDVCENTTPIVGATSCSVVAPDLEHIRRILQVRRPVLVIVCGKQAETTLIKEWTGPMLSVPHPASRVLTSALYAYGRTLIQDGKLGRVALRQRPGRIEEVQL